MPRVLERDSGQPTARLVDTDAVGISFVSGASQAVPPPSIGDTIRAACWAGSGSA